MPYSSLWQYVAIFFLGDSIRPLAAFHRLDGSNYCTDLFYRHGIRLQRVCFLVARELMLSDLIVVKPGLHVFLNMNELIVVYTWRFLWILTRVLNLILSWFPITENTFITNRFSGFWHLILRMGYISKDYFSSAFVHLLKVIGLRLCIISGINLNCHSLYIYMHVHIYTCIHTSIFDCCPLSIRNNKLERYKVFGFVEFFIE